jgi:putative phosphoribosyl transferase
MTYVYAQLSKILNFGKKFCRETQTPCVQRHHRKALQSAITSAPSPLTIRRIFGAATGPTVGSAGQSASIGAGGRMLAKALIHIGIGAVEMEGMLELPHNALGIVLFAHGSASSRLSPRNNYVARVLREAGIGSLLLDLLTIEEDRFYDTRFDIDLLTRRLCRAARWLGEQDATLPLPLGLFGASTGPAALPAVGAPTLLIVGGNDHDVITLNRKALAELNCPKDLVIVPGAGHLFEEAGALEQVARLAAGWFAGHVARS